MIQDLRFKDNDEAKNFEKEVDLYFKSDYSRRGEIVEKHIEDNEAVLKFLEAIEKKLRSQKNYKILEKISPVLSLLRRKSSHKKIIFDYLNLTRFS